MSVNFYQTTRPHIPEDGTLTLYCLLVNAFYYKKKGRKKERKKEIRDAG
jgi:hypothetical protein